MGFKHFKFRVDTFIILILLYHCALAQYIDPNNHYDENYNNNNELDYNAGENDQVKLSAKNENKSIDNCWFTLDAAIHFKAMDELDEQFKQARQAFQSSLGEEMNRLMLDELLSSRGAAHRTIHKFGGDSLKIPAGLNLGGYCLIRLYDSILFFHRMKLRNSTIFQVNVLHNDLENMVLIVRLGLNDLHLVGTYERSATHTDPSVLYYRPSYGTVEVLLRNVDYKMEARLRMMSDRLTIELLTSELITNGDILMSYLNTNLTSEPEYIVRMQKRNMDDFLQRLKTDLDLWLKDYFNDFLMYFHLPTNFDYTEIQEYENKKTVLLNEYVNYAVNTIRQKIFNLGGHSLKLPKFTIFSVPNMVLKIKDGILRGMDSMYCRSVATGKKNNKVRAIDVIIGFSNFKAEYKFETVLPNGSPPLTGSLILTADEMTAHMGISLVMDPESLDLNFDFIQQLQPETLTIEGSANRVIANFKHHLEHQIIALITNVIIHNIKMLNTLTRCEPFIYGYGEEDSYFVPNEINSARSGSKNDKVSKPKTKRQPIGRSDQTVPMKKSKVKL